MVATIGQMASAEYYLESQRSYRHPNEYYTAGEEPDGTWFNPKGLLGLEDGGKVDSGHFHRLYSGFAPDGARKLVQRAGNPDRSPGVDMTFSVDKSVSALWAIAEPEMRERIEAMAVSAARAAVEDTVFRYCSYTRVAEKGVTRPVEADLIGATFVHGTSRENDPQLHVHCTIFNVARTHEDGKWRAHHQYPVYSWKKAAGAMFRANMAWELQQGLGVHMEQYGPANEFTRIAGMPDDLKAFWSKRRKAIVAMAGELGIPALGNASRMAGVNKITREGKSHDNDPEVRHRRWRGEAEGFCEREELIASVTGHSVEIGREAIRELTDRLHDLPAHLAREEAVFRRPDMVEAAANAAAGLLGREAVGTAIERLRRNPEIERLAPKKPTAESLAGMVHTEVYSTRHNLGLEQAVKDMTAAMAADTGHALPEQAVKEKVETLLEQGYPLSQEQSLAIRHAQAVDVLRVRPMLLRRHRGQAERALANVDLYLGFSRAYAVRGLRAFAEAMTAAWSDEARAVEGRPDAQEEAVALYTMHAAKGLEWPIVVPINTMTRVVAADSAVTDRASGRFHCRVFGVEPSGYEAARANEKAELDRERVRLWYVAATRARELLVLPRLDVDAAASAWLSVVDLDLPGLPALDLDHLPSELDAGEPGAENEQTREVFAAEATAIAERTRSIVWRTPSRDEGAAHPVVREEAPTILATDGDGAPADSTGAAPIQGGRERGLILHKLIEEVLTGETAENLPDLCTRAEVLIRALDRPVMDDPSEGLAPPELAECVVRVLSLPEIATLRPRLVPEFAVYAADDMDAHEEAAAGIVDAIAFDADGKPEVVIDWKSDIDPSPETVEHYRAQVHAYLEMTGAERGLVVFMTSGITNLVGGNG